MSDKSGVGRRFYIFGENFFGCIIISHHQQQQKRQGQQTARTVGWTSTVSSQPVLYAVVGQPRTLIPNPHPKFTDVNYSIRNLSFVYVYKFLYVLRSANRKTYRSKRVS